MNIAKQIRAWWQSLTGQSRTNDQSDGGWRRPESLCPECGSEDIQLDFNKETSTQRTSCPDCGYSDRHEVLPENDLRPQKRMRA